MKAPSAPNPAQVAQQQQQSNLQTAQQQAALNAGLGNNSNAYGTNTVQRDANGDPTGQTQTLSPALQALLQQREGLAGQIGGAQSQIAGSLPTGPVDPNFGNSVNQAAQAAYGAQTGFLQPQFDLQNKQLQSQLDSRGLPIGSEARTDATNNQQNSQNLALTQAANNAYGAGLNAENQGFNQGVTNQMMPYQQLASLNGSNPTSSLLGSAPGPANLQGANIQPTNVAGITQQSYQDQLAAQQYNSSQLFGGLLGLGTLGLGGYNSGLFGGGSSGSNAALEADFV